MYSFYIIYASINLTALRKKFMDKKLLNGTIITFNLNDEELKIFREIWEDGATKRFFGGLKLSDLDSAVDKISEAIAPVEPEKPVTLDDYFKF